MTKQMIGKVVGTKMQKTLVIEVASSRRHPIYKKIMRRVRRFKVHNENPEIKLGELIRVIETRPLSKEKRWKVLEVVK